MGHFPQEIADGGDGHGIEGRNAPVQQVCNQKANHNTGNIEPVDGCLSVATLEFVPVAEIVQDYDDADRRQCAVEDAQPAHKVPVQPDGKGRTHDTGNPSGDLHADIGNVGNCQTAGIQGVIIGGPDVGTQHNQGRDGQTLCDHDIEDVICTGKRAANSAEAEHQSIAQEEGNHSGPHGDLAVFGEADEVWRGSAAGDKGTNDIANAGEQGDAASGLGKNGSQTAAVCGCSAHGVDTQNNNQRHRDVTDDLQRLHAGGSSGGHQQAGSDGEQPFIDPQKLGRRDGEHGNSHAKPADLCKTQNERGQVRTLSPEGAAAEQIHIETSGGADVGQKTTVRRQNQAAENTGPDKARQIQTVSKFCSYAHAGGEEGKAKHYEEHVPEPLTG